MQGYYDVPCPDCGEPMPALLQIASEDNIPYMFGDCGIGHVFLCPHHPARACFDWSCF